MWHDLGLHGHFGSHANQKLDKQQNKVSEHHKWQQKNKDTSMSLLKFDSLGLLYTCIHWNSKQQQ